MNGSFCACCLNALNDRRLRTLYSKITAIPQGLDRREEAAVNILFCTRCGHGHTMHSPGGSGPFVSTEVNRLKEVHQKTWTRELTSIVGPPPGANRRELLDIGCGAGQDLYRFTMFGYNAFGIDPDISNVVYAKKIYGLNCESISIEALPVEKVYDVILMTGVLEHIPDPVACLSKISDLMARNARLFVSVPNSSSCNAWLSNFLGYGHDMLFEPGHVHHFNPTSLDYLVSRVPSLCIYRRHSVNTVNRGKWVLLPFRSPKLEEWTRHLSKRSKLFHLFYILVQASFSIGFLGDILVYEIRRSEDV